MKKNQHRKEPESIQHKTIDPVKVGFEIKFSLEYS